MDRVHDVLWAMHLYRLTGWWDSWCDDHGYLHAAPIRRAKS